ncbi:PE family protein, partial [Mycobacterium attenuatum]|uniref:PE family protein n=1 Tax=Mycobacterium attenuatum TaxID=2341086 RepID=UPI0010A971A4
MSFVGVVPELVAQAAADVAGVSSLVGQANAAAWLATTRLVAAGGDEVSAAIAALFNAQAHEYQGLAAQLNWQMNSLFAGQLKNVATAYASAESASMRTLSTAASSSPLQILEQQVLNVVNAPSEVLTGRPLIGNGANGAAGTGAAGGDGGWIYGNGGSGGSGASGQAGG